MAMNRTKTRYLLAATLCAALILYPLSMGPAWRAWRKHDAISEETYLATYAPIIWILKRSDFIDGIWGKYLAWWWLPGD